MKTKEQLNKADSGAICGDGMCPYIPCVKHPYCEHMKAFMKELRKKRK